MINIPSWVIKYSKMNESINGKTLIMNLMDLKMEKEALNILKNTQINYNKLN